MRLWRLTRTAHAALDGIGTLKYGGRYTSPGHPVVNFASEPGLAVLVALRYLPSDLAGIPEDYVLGWTEIVAEVEQLPADETRAAGDAWLVSQRSLLAAIPSAVLPEASIVLMNPRHSDAAKVSPLVTRPFNFAECLHVPPMLGKYRED